MNDQAQYLNAAGGMLDAYAAPPTPNAMGQGDGSDPLLPKRREVWDHANFDLDLLHEIPDIGTMKPGWKFKFETIMGTWILFNSISTLMIITTNMKRAVSVDLLTEYGEEKFEALMGFIIYFPLCFFFLLFLLFNNYFSEMTFYHYLRRGALVDFPASSDAGFLFKNPLPLAFILVTLGYCGVAFYAMIVFRASFGTILIFCNNLLIGIGMFWYRQQSIEWKFISISDFIQAFPDRTNSHGNMDEVSLHRASQLMDHFTLTESHVPSYRGYMRNWWWKNQNYTTHQQIMHHVGMVLLVGGLGGCAFAYFFVLGRLDLESRWNNEINPCIRTCVEGALRVNSTFFNVTAEFCSWCTCACLNNIRMKDDHTLQGCGSYFAENLEWCPGRSQSCPATCNFKQRGGFNF